MQIKKHVYTLLLTSFVLIAGGMIFCPVPPAAAHGTGSDHVHAENQDGIDTADLWLELVDSERYQAAWQTASKMFRSRISREDWAKAVSGVRAPLGDLVQRKLFHHRATRTMPGAPDGAYLVLRYKTAFVHKAAAIETVTLVQTPKDGSWRVVGYVVK